MLFRYDKQNVVSIYVDCRHPYRVFSQCVLLFVAMISGIMGQCKGTSRGIFLPGIRRLDYSKEGLFVLGFTGLTRFTEPQNALLECIKGFCWLLEHFFGGFVLVISEFYQYLCFVAPLVKKKMQTYMFFILAAFADITSSVNTIMMIYDVT